MSFLGKSRPAPDRAVSVATPDHVRLSNGLKDFLWHLSDVERGHLLDLGPASQSTVTFFTGRGFKIYTEDLLRAWRDYLRAEEERLRAAPVGTSAGPMDSAALAERFTQANLLYPPETFHAVLAWDVFDFLDAGLLPRVVAALHSLLKPAGAILAVFHSRPATSFHRYRVLDAQNVELLPAPPLSPLQRVLQNREILNLFAQFRSSKTFVGRDQLREGLFLK